MESFAAHDTNEAVLVEPLHRILPLVAEAHLDQLLCRLLQVKLLVVEEAVRLLQGHFFSFVVVKGPNGQVA